MNHYLKGLLHMASQFLTDIEAKIGTIVAAEDPEAVKAEIMADITTATADLTKANTDLAARVSDLETALTDTVAHLAKGDVAAATATATAAAPAADAGAVQGAGAAGTANTAS
jgi:hypothetical protein